MKQNEINYATIKNTIKILAVMCACPPEKIIDLLTDHLWDEKEAKSIKRSNGEFVIGTPADCHCRSFFSRTGEHIEDCPCFEG